MVYIRTDETNRIVYCHRQPFDSVHGMGETKDSLEKTGYFIDEMPDPKVAIGYRAIPYYNPETKKVTYTYVAAELPNEEKLKLLEGAMNELLLNGVQTGGDTDGN